VAGGNVETSQRVVDALLLAFGQAACSQGTMNNLIFGTRRAGHYENDWARGGRGAGVRGGRRRSHVHMTNTAITDAEVLERRYPVRLRAVRGAARIGGAREMARRGRDGAGSWNFWRRQSVSMLTQRRASGPDGVAGGAAGAPGKQTLTRVDGSEEVLGSLAHFEAQAGMC